MNFELNDEQRALQDSISRLLADRYGFEKRRGFAASPAGHDEGTWHKLGELGVTALLVPEAHGGFGGGACDLLPVMQELGAALSLEPFLASSVLGATAIRLVADAELQDRLLPSVAAGTTCVVWAHDEAAGRHSPNWVETRARRQGDQWMLDGGKANVLAAGLAQHFVVTARVSGAADAPDGCALFLVDAGAAGLETRVFRMVDDSPAGELNLRGVAALPLGDPTDGEGARAAIDTTLAIGTAAACADMVGAMQAAFRLAMDYLNTRKQFGRLIGENQALRHRAADMLVSLELARSMAIAAAVAVDRPEGADAALDVHRAKLSVGRHARTLAHGAIQLHGGIGMTEEYAVGHYLRRIHVLDQLFGDGDAHATRLAALA
ncbi:acyl-CoA dehydrogenase family protein [Hydrogenophaga sp.]|uniref:acyl-CoA dehydrogenase family protein n=1 Tax=Hydrogenophaga sp. TaxID=1904254 RepID=UPI002728FC95|nr:acyl-CoA dehydrogenase family protein [Hydrogenophaga sp.]MDO9504294.1 acyl-CoA dehydrogenase family protein [Hydrogenophaga sp.]